MPFQFETALAVEYGGLINLTYNMYNLAIPPNEYTPPYNGLPDPPPYNALPQEFDFAGWIRMNDFTPEGQLRPKFYGIIVQRKSNLNAFVVVIRGTEASDWDEWWDNFTSVVPKRTPGFVGKVGDGFGKIFESIRILDANRNPTDEFGTGFVQQVAAAASRKLVGADVAKQKAVLNKISIEVTGHSLGGALATLYTARNAGDKQLEISKVYTFASPFVGDAEFVNAYNSLGIETWRIANFWDWVPNLPPNLAFRHVNQAYPINSMFEVHADPVCWHSMLTYLHVLDPSIDIDPGCNPLPPDPHYIAGH